MKTILSIAALVTLGFAAPATAVTINFDNLANGAVVTNQYAEATFSSQSGSQIFTTAQNYNTSLPNFICSGVGSINCVDDVYLDFTNPVSNLSFIAVGDNMVGPNALVRAFAGATLLGTLDIIGDDNLVTNYFVSLPYSGITRLEIINNIDPAGLGFDDFTFNVGPRVPEPATWALFIAGFGLIGAAARRRTARTA